MHPNKDVQTNRQIAIQYGTIVFFIEITAFRWLESSEKHRLCMAGTAMVVSSK